MLMYRPGLSLRLHKPEGWQAADCRPVVVWFHGGGWHSGEAARFDAHCAYLAEQGVVACSVTYRLLGDQASQLSDCVADACDAIDYLRDNAHRLGIDPDRIAAAGDSAGGHLAAMLGTRDNPRDNVNAVIVCGAVLELRGRWLRVLTGQTVAPLSVWRSVRQEAKRLSPLDRVSSGQPPLLILHGSRDRTVVPAVARRYAEAHRQVGNEVQLIIYPWARHAFILFGYSAEEAQTRLALGDIGQFLQELRWV